MVLSSANLSKEGTYLHDSESSYHRREGLTALEGSVTEGEVGRERKQLSLKPPREVAYYLSGSGCNGQKY